MKKLLAVCLSVLTFLSLALVLVGCGNGTGGLQYGKKYCSDSKSTINAENETDKCYYVFNKNGTGLYHNYYVSTDYPDYVEKITDYTITFSYTFVDKEKEAVVCTFESVEYAERHSASKSTKSDWSKLLTVSENVLMTSGGSLYFNSSYLAKHPNFYKEAE